MPIIKSAKKRVRVARKAAIRNLKVKRGLKAALKALTGAKSKAKAEESLRKTQSALGKAGKKGVMHKNKVARKQRQLAKRAKAAGLTPKTVTKTSAKKSVAKKTGAKRTPATPAAKRKNPRPTKTKKPSAKR